MKRTKQKHTKLQIDPPNERNDQQLNKLSKMQREKTRNAMRETSKMEKQIFLKNC